MVYETLLEKIKQYPNKTVEYTKLESMCPPGAAYEDFAEDMLKLEQAGILVRKKTAGSNGKTPALAMKYDISRAAYQRDYHNLLMKKRREWDERIGLEAYFALDESTFAKDAPYLQRIHDILWQRPLPGGLYIPELSFLLVQDEKWIDEKGGRRVLERIGLWPKLQVNDRIDPAAFALNPSRLDARDHIHLIMENKTPFHHGLDALEGSCFSTLIYGQGWKIVSSLKLFGKQFPLQGSHRFVYFGDLDYEGLAIFASLKEQTPIKPAAPFYQALLQMDSVPGKDNQMENQEALALFSEYLDHEEAEILKDGLKQGRYYPQEMLNREAIERIMANY